MEIFRLSINNYKRNGSFQKIEKSKLNSFSAKQREKERKRMSNKMEAGKVKSEKWKENKNSQHTQIK